MTPRRRERTERSVELGALSQIRALGPAIRVSSLRNDLESWREVDGVAGRTAMRSPRRRGRCRRAPTARLSEGRAAAFGYRRASGWTIASAVPGALGPAMALATRESPGGQAANSA